MYREGLDGLIGVRLVPDTAEESGKRLDMVTILDMSTVYQDKRESARYLANQYESLHHENLLNLIEPVCFESTHIPDGLMIFVTEAPDHRLSWKTFCKLTFDLEQQVSIFR